MRLCTHWMFTGFSNRGGRRAALLLLLLVLSGVGMTAQPYNASMFTTTTTAFNSYAQRMKLVDVNGDGYPDMCWVVPVDGVYCALYTNGQFGAPSRWSAGFRSTPNQVCTPANLNGPGTCTTTSNYDDPSVWETIQFVDVDRDGKVDVCGRNPEGFVCYLSTGTGFEWSVSGSYLFSNAADPRWWTDPSYYETIRMADVNHDGYPDVCGRNSQGIVCLLAYPHRVPDPIDGTPQWFFGSGDYDVVYGFDFGDNNGWNKSPAYWSTIQFADVDGNGSADVCGRGQHGIICARFNGTPVIIGFNWDGSPIRSLVFDQVAIWTTQFSDAYGWNQPQYYSTLQFVDMNGDGKADVCGRGGAGFYCAFSNGLSFQGGFSLVANNFSDANGWNQPDHYQNMFWIKDVNGDGMPDICGRGSQGIICQLQQGPYMPFSGPILWVNNFGDNYGWGTQPYYWGSVQIVAVPRAGWPNFAFCGHGSAGIWCTSFNATGATL